MCERERYIYERKVKNNKDLVVFKLLLLFTEGLERQGRFASY